MIGGHGASGPLVLGPEPGQDTALEPGQTFKGHGHPLNLTYAGVCHIWQQSPLSSEMAFPLGVH